MEEGELRKMTLEEEETRRASNMNSEGPSPNSSFNNIGMQSQSCGELSDGEISNIMSPQCLHTVSGFNWAKEKQMKRRFYDDGTMTYFW